VSDCKHERTFSAGGKSSDMSSGTFHDGTEFDGEMPYPDFGLGSGDYFNVTVCLDCHRVIGFDPEKYEKARASTIEENADRKRRREERQQNPRW